MTFGLIATGVLSQDEGNTGTPSFFREEYHEHNGVCCCAPWVLLVLPLLPVRPLPGKQGSETSTAEQTYPGFAIPQGQTHHQLESSRTELSRGAFVSYSSSNFGMISTRSMAIS